MNNSVCLTLSLFAEYLAAFHSFLQSEFSEENIEFWLACEEFRLTTSPEDLQWRAEEIYREFIQPTACREVSLSVIPELNHISYLKEEITFLDFLSNFVN